MEKSKTAIQTPTMRLDSRRFGGGGALLSLKRAFQTLAYRCVYTLVYAASLLPIRWLYGAGHLAFLLAYHIIGYRKQTVIQNIARSFPDKRYDQVQATAEEFYRCLTGYFAEIIKAVSASAPSLDGKITFENLQLIEQHIRAGKNVIGCLGHCANWEMLHFMACKTAYPVHAVYKPLRSKTIDRLMIRLRSRFGMKLIADRSVVRRMQSGNSDRALYLFLADQCPPVIEEKFKYSFLHQPTYVFSGMEKLARKTGSAVVYLHITRLARGRYKINCLPVCPDAGSMSPGQITRVYVDLLAENIREQPHGWLWTHKRWKR